MKSMLAFERIFRAKKNINVAQAVKTADLVDRTSKRLLFTGGYRQNPSPLLDYNFKSNKKNMMFVAIALK